MAQGAREREDKVTSQDWFASADPWVEVNRKVRQTFLGYFVLC